MPLRSRRRGLGRRGGLRHRRQVRIGSRRRDDERERGSLADGTQARMLAQEVRRLDADRAAAVTVSCHPPAAKALPPISMLATTRSGDATGWHRSRAGATDRACFLWRVNLWRTPEWVRALVEESASSLNAAHDDRVDALSQGAARRGRAGGRRRRDCVLGDDRGAEAIPWASRRPWSTTRSGRRGRAAPLQRGAVPRAGLTVEEQAWPYSIYGTSEGLQQAAG